MLTNLNFFVQFEYFSIRPKTFVFSSNFRYKKQLLIIFRATFEQLFKKLRQIFWKISTSNLWKALPTSNLWCPTVVAFRPCEISDKTRYINVPFYKRCQPFYPFSSSYHLQNLEIISLPKKKVCLVSMLNSDFPRPVELIDSFRKVIK